MTVKNTHIGLMLFSAWILILLAKPMAATLDDLTTPQPWFDAQIEIVSSATGTPAVRYTRFANRYMRGNWVVEVQVQTDKGPSQICSGDGQNTYDPQTIKTNIWPWAYFIGANCPVPTTPFRLCADHQMTDRSGRKRAFGPSCSPYFNPQQEHK